MDCERADSGATILPEAPPATPPHPPATPRIVPSPARVRRLPWPHERIDLSNPLPSPKDLGTSDNYTFLGKSYHLSSPPVATWDDCSYGWHGHSEEANLQQTTDPAVASGSGPPSTERPVPQSALDRTSSCSPASPTDRTDVGSLGSVISKLSLEEETESGVSPSTRLRHPFTGCGSGQDSPESGHKTERYTRVVHYHVSPRTCPSNNPGDAPRGNGAQNSRNSARRFRKTGADGTAGISQNHGGNAPDEESGDDSREHREKDRSGAGNNTNNRRAQPALDSPLACPFRKRNKERFNVRDHRQCTVPFKNFTYVKRHIRDCHMREDAYECPRCWRQFEEEDRLQGHVSSQTCTPRQPPQRRDDPTDYEAGITATAASLLIHRKDNTKICTWEDLWELLFPGDARNRVIPSPEYEPCVVMEDFETRKIAQTSWMSLRAPGTTRDQISDILPSAIGKDRTVVVSQVWDTIESSWNDSFENRLQVFRHTVLSNLPNRRSAKSSRRQDRGTHAAGTQSGPTGTPIQQLGQQQVQRQRPLAPSSTMVVGSYTGSSNPQSRYAGPAPHPPYQGHTGYGTNVCPSGTEPEQGVWNAHRATGLGASAIAAPAPVQHPITSQHMQAFLQSLPLDSSARHAPANDMQQSQTSASSSYPASNLGPAESYASYRGSFPSDPLNAPETQQGSELYEHPSQRYGYYDHPGYDWTDMPGNDANQGTE